MRTFGVALLLSAVLAVAAVAFAWLPHPLSRTGVGVTDGTPARAIMRPIGGAIRGPEFAGCASSPRLTSGMRRFASGSSGADTSIGANVRKGRWAVALPHFRHPSGHAQLSHMPGQFR